MFSRQTLTDYDLAVRSISEETTDKFISLAKDEEQKKKRGHLVDFISYYRDPRNLEEYCRKYFKIQTKKDGIIPFVWKPAQRTFYNQRILPKILNHEPIDIYLLKARQIGFSTLIEAMGSAYASLFSDFKASVIAHDVETSSKIHEMCKLYIKSIPKKYRPAQKISNKKELTLSNPRSDDDRLGLESSFIVKTARNKHLGAGHTLRFLHLSELARYEEVNPDAEVSLTTLFNALPHDAPFVFRLIETTAYGEGIGKRFWDDEDNGFENVFISWIADDTYTGKFPLKEELNYSEDHEYGNEILAQEKIIRELQTWYPESVDDTEWLKEESLYRLQWRREVIKRKHFGKVDLFNQEYPLTPEEAFLATGKCVFDTRILKELEEKAIKRNKEDPVPRYEFVPPSKSDDNEKVFGELIKAPLGEVSIYEFPIPGMIYNLGVDCSAGLQDGDYQAIQVFNERNQQALRYQGYADPDNLAQLIALISGYYNDATAVIEANTYGLSVINYLVKIIGFTNLYRRERLNSIKGGVTEEWGFYTSSRTRPLLIDLLRRSLVNKELVLRDLPTIEEFKHFIYTVKNKKLKMEAAGRFHDDLVMGSGLGIFNLANEIELKHNEESSGTPVGSVDWYAQQADIQYNNSLTIGSVVGMY